MTPQLEMIGQILASLVDMAKGSLGDQFAVSIIARHRHMPAHLLLGDDTELAIIGALSEIMRQGVDIATVSADGTGGEADPREASPTDHMFNLLQEAGEQFRTYQDSHSRKAEEIGISESKRDERRRKANVNRDLADRIERVLDMVRPAAIPTP